MLFTQFSEMDFYSAWFQKCNSFAKQDQKAYWEIESAVLGSSREWTAEELWKAAASSQVYTFNPIGWPVGSCSDSKGFSSESTAEGIMVQIDNGRYQTWCASLKAEFFFRESYIPEDDHPPWKNTIYFNTRLVRITEGILRYAGMCRQLGVDPDAELVFRIEHSGLADRRLSRYGVGPFPNDIQRFACTDSFCASAIKCKLSSVESQITELVKEVAEPLFAVFDFGRLPDSLIDDVVSSFVKGECK